jgi:glycosidase
MGTSEDVRAWIQRSHDLGLDVVLDIPLNHTSPSHAWASRHDWFIRDSAGKAISPSGTNWCDVHQLNHNHAQVVEELQRVLEFWVEVGFDGFRYDAAAWMSDDCIETLIRNVNASSSRFIHHWCDSRDMMAKHAFTAYLDHESYHLMAMGKDIHDEPPENRNAIRYLTNHDTLQQGRSVKDIFGSRYLSLREKLQSCEWRNPESVYSFLR